jgi:hypothetical protein
MKHGHSVLKFDAVSNGSALNTSLRARFFITTFCADSSYHIYFWALASHFHLSKIRWISFSAVRTASSALISSRATLANIVLRMKVLTTSLIAFVA